MVEPAVVESKPRFIAGYAANEGWVIGIRTEWGTIDFQEPHTEFGFSGWDEAEARAAELNENPDAPRSREP